MKKCIAILCLQSAFALRLTPMKLSTELSEKEMEQNTVKDFEPSKELIAGWKDAFMQNRKEESLDKADAEYNVNTVPSTCTREILEGQTSGALKHPECVEPWPKTANCEKAYELPEYRLGDAFWHRPGNNNPYLKAFFPESIAAKYLKTKPKGVAIYDALLNVTEQPEYQSMEKPSPNQMVVHLRLGGGFGERPNLSKLNQTYEKYAKQGKDLGFHEVVLVTGDHMYKQQAAVYKWNVEKAEKKAQLVEEAVQHVADVFETEGFKVTKRVNYNADCDFVFMVNAPYFQHAPGGFSNIAYELWKMKHSKTEHN